MQIFAATTNSNFQSYAANNIPEIVSRYAADAGFSRTYYTHIKIDEVTKGIFDFKKDWFWKPSLEHGENLRNQVVNRVLSKLLRPEVAVNDFEEFARARHGTFRTPQLIYIGISNSASSAEACLKLMQFLASIIQKPVGTGESIQKKWNICIIPVFIGRIFALGDGEQSTTGYQLDKIYFCPSNNFLKIDPQEHKAFQELSEQNPFLAKQLLTATGGIPVFTQRMYYRNLQSRSCYSDLVPIPKLGKKSSQTVLKILQLAYFGIKVQQNSLVNDGYSAADLEESGNLYLVPDQCGFFKVHCPLFLMYAYDEALPQLKLMGERLYLPEGRKYINHLITEKDLVHSRLIAEIYGYAWRVLCFESNVETTFYDFHRGLLEAHPSLLQRSFMMQMLQSNVDIGQETKRSENNGQVSIWIEYGLKDYDASQPSAVIIETINDHKKADLMLPGRFRVKVLWDKKQLKNAAKAQITLEDIDQHFDKSLEELPVIIFSPFAAGPGVIAKITSDENYANVGLIVGENCKQFMLPFYTLTSKNINIKH